MESNDNEEKSQENVEVLVSSSKQNDEKNPDYNQVALEMAAELSPKVQFATSGNEMICNESLAKLTKHTKTIFSKLSTKRQQLLLQTNQVESNEEAAKENDLKVVKVLQTMGNKTIITMKKPAEIHLPNGTLPNGGLTKPNVMVPNIDIIRPLNQHSKIELVSLVEGLQELVCKLTCNDENLKLNAERLAHNIIGLRNLSIFPNALQSGPSTSKAAKERRDSESKENNRKDSEKSVNDKAQEAREKNKCKKEPTPAEIFAKYINVILKEYLGEQQEDKLEKYKCLATQIEDLESYSSILVQAGFGHIVEGEVRISRKNNRQAFVSLSKDRETIEKDAIISLPVARRYAFEGDIVRVFVFNTITANNNSTATENSLVGKKDREKSSHITEGNNSLCLGEDEELFDKIETELSLETEKKEITDVLDTSITIVSENCCKAFVIKIVKQTELREIIGSVSFMNDTILNTKSYYNLRPHDTRVPMVYIPKELCLEELQSINKEDICGMLYVARVLETDINGHCIGELVQPVGRVGNLKAEIKAILLQNSLKGIKPYEQKFLEMYEGPMPPLSEEDLKQREDLREKCVFTIDPLTAKDLDDAVSVEKLNDQEYEIGVHISDVAHYLSENSELDEIVKLRATTIYLVNEVIHMLPPSLCFRCSLLPGQDKFAFSVFWKWHIEKQEFSKPRFTRTLINSCSQFAYEHAQKIIDNPTEDFDSDDFPELFNGWTPTDIKWRVLLLHQIAQQLKARRYENGALSINKPKLRFQFDPKTGEPLSYEIERRQEANFLIEEFMLLANQSAARFIYDHFPNISILRNHSPPLQKSMIALKERLNKLGLEFDINSSKSIYESMQRLICQASDHKAVEACLSNLLRKPMARAHYFCSEGKTSDADLWHYALSIPIYTHFTSPIRRYPDILVHRLLAAALNYCPPPQRTTDELHNLAKICNVQKYNAKNADNDSIELFFKRYIKAKQSITLRAVVTDISKQMLNVVTIETGHTISIIYRLQKVLVNTTNVPTYVTISEKNSQFPPLKLQVFSTFDINIVLRYNEICGFIASPDIKQRRLNNSESSKREENSNPNKKTITPSKSKKRKQNL